MQAFCFLPTDSHQQFFSCAIFTHGYTSHKGSLLNWGVQLAHKNIPTIIFDLPGHYLGSFNEVEDTDDFEEYLHHLFQTAFISLKQHTSLDSLQNIILGGHSLGALLSLRASNLDIFKAYQRYLFPIGYGIRKEGEPHPLLTSFFKPLLETRSQLVSPAIAPEEVLHWVEQSKHHDSCKDNTIYLVTGEDDVLITSEDLKRTVEKLKEKNRVILEVPKHLPHHQPELAIKFILRFLKQSNLLPKI